MYLQRTLNETNILHVVIENWPQPSISLKSKTDSIK